MRTPISLKYYSLSFSFVDNLKVENEEKMKKFYLLDKTDLEYKFQHRENNLLQLDKGKKTIQFLHLFFTSNNYCHNKVKPGYQNERI